MTYRQLVEKLNPAFSREWLFLAAGLVWSGVGILLCKLALGWLIDLRAGWALWVGLIGLALGYGVHKFGFSHIANKNVNRLHGLLGKTCLFAAFPWKSYILMVFMMGLGIVLRHSPLPRAGLALVYATIGGAMFLSSLRYYPPALTILKESK